MQRVREARVTVGDELVGSIGPGLAVLVGVKDEDTEADARYIAEKIAHLRVFDDGQGRMDQSAIDARKAVLVVSQFTLFGDARKGRRPSYTRAARGETAVSLYVRVATVLRELGLEVATGRFGAEMRVDLAGDGPVTILLDSEKLF